MSVAGTVVGIVVAFLVIFGGLAFAGEWWADR